MRNTNLVFGKIGPSCGILLASVFTLNVAYGGVIELSPARDIWTTSFYPYNGNNLENRGIGGGLNNDELRVGGWGDQYRSLMLFDLSEISKPVNSASLQLYNMDNPDRYPVTMKLDVVTSDWDWTTEPLGAGTLDNERLWWDDRPTYVQYEQGLHAPGRDAFWEWDVTNLVNDQINGTYHNYGIQLRPETTTQNNNFFASSEHENEDWHPKLILDTSSPTSPNCGSVNFANSVSVSATDATMGAGFIPDNGCTLGNVATALGYDHFNWVQVINRYDGILWWGITPLGYFGTPFLDPPPGGYNGRPADSLPYYWDEGPGFEDGYTLQEHIFGDSYLQFYDTPHLDHDSLPGGIMSFTTSLVGVVDGDIWVPEFTFDWMSNFRLDEGGIIDGARNLDSGLPGTGGIFDVQVLSDPLAVPPEVRRLWIENGANISVPVPSTLLLIVFGSLGIWVTKGGRAHAMLGLDHRLGLR